jgi:hypothetical protein
LKFSSGALAGSMSSPTFAVDAVHCSESLYCFGLPLADEISKMVGKSGSVFHPQERCQTNMAGDCICYLLQIHSRMAQGAQSETWKHDDRG